MQLANTLSPNLCLPVVDVADLYGRCYSDRLIVAYALEKAARESGFLYIRGHGISPNLINRLQRVTRSYFDQPFERKMRNYIGNSGNHSGYVPGGEEQFDPNQPPDRKEAYDIGFEYEGRPQLWPMVGANQWPEFPDFRATVSAYYRAVYELANRLFCGFALALGLPERTLLDKVTAPPSQLRLIHYPRGEASQNDRPGIGAHTD